MSPSYLRKWHFDHLMQDLANDFYVVEIQAGHYDFANGVLKSWWAKYYA